MSRSNLPRGEVLVAYLPDKADMVLARENHWYRIPVSSANKWLKNRWPPRWLALYQPKVFGDEAFAVKYFAQVIDIKEVLRVQLFPDQPNHPHAGWLYYQLFLDTLQTLPRPIPSRRFRRITFIPTTWPKFVGATEINDLFDDSPLEDRIWTGLRRLGISAERQEFITANKRSYALDFALYCSRGKLDVEADGDSWHADPNRIPLDNLRDNDLETNQWKLLRFNSRHINEALESYCLPTIVENINNLGGLAEGRVIPRKFSLDTEAPQQLSLFDDQSDPTEKS